MFVNMENLVHDIVNHNLQNRTIALVENGSWAPTAGGLMRAEFQKLKGCTILDETLTIKSVSYTHLDVYKRQEVCFPIRKK